MLEALCCIELQPNFLILVKNHNFDGSFGLAETIDAYFNRYNLKDRVNMCLSW